MEFTFTTGLQLDTALRRLVPGFFPGSDGAAKLPFLAVGTRDDAYRRHEASAVECCRAVEAAPLAPSCVGSEPASMTRPKKSTTAQRQTPGCIRSVTAKLLSPG